jgi:hypothetical protein
MKWLQRVTLVAVPALVAACIFPTDSCACVLVPPSAIAFGTVVTTAGAPIPGARVVQEVGTGSSCEGTANGALDVGTSDADGSYEGQLGILPDARACVRLRASSPGFASVTAIGMVEGKASADPAALERVRFDFVLAPAQ